MVIDEIMVVQKQYMQKHVSVNELSDPECVRFLRPITLEKERDKLLSLPMEVVQCNSNLGIGGAVLDSGAMRNSGDASRTASGANSRRPLKEKLRVRGVHGNDKPVLHDFDMRIPSAIEGQDIKLSKTLDIPGSAHDLVSSCGATG